MYLPCNTLLQGGKYKVVRFLSNGGFGNTYEGVHTMMDTRVAIKEFFPKMFCNRDEKTSQVTLATQGNRELLDKLRKKFNEEAKAVFQMSHPNIVRVIDIFEEYGTAYYVMEYIDGKSLNDMVKERGALPEAEAVGYIRQVADALKFVHSFNRLHLDIKPGNIMVDKNGKAVLIDFGASKHYDLETGENTSTLLGVNTPGYAPAEQSYRGFVKFSASTDIYALGATLYKLLTGITPPDAQMLKDGEAELPPLPFFVSAAIKNAVKESMRPLRKDRPQDIPSFKTLLDKVNVNDGSDKEETIIDSQQAFVTIHGYTEKYLKNSEIEVYKDGKFIGKIKRAEKMEVPLENSSSVFLFKSGRCKLEGKIRKGVDTHVFLWTNRLYGGLYAEKSNDENAMKAEREKDKKARSATQKTILLMIPGPNLFALIFFLPLLIKNWPWKKKYF